MTLYVPPLFRIDDQAKLAEFIARNAFGTLVSSGEDGLRVSHIPFLPEVGADGKLRLLGHVARANGQWRELEGAREVLAIFQGPHGYISPTWYENHPAVPTWNYAVVHAHGKVRPLDEAGLRRLIGRLSDTYEAGRPNPWRMEAQADEFLAGLVKAIVGFELEVERLEGKFKLSQNRPGNDALRVVEALEREGESALAALMREHPRKA
jgi:transcriptional regulator